MCKSSGGRRIDPCMKHLISVLSEFIPQYKILACCCGHKKYPMTIVFDGGYGPWELISDEQVPRKKKFYKRDKDGMFYIPESIGVFK